MKASKCGVSFSCSITIDKIEEKIHIPLDIIDESKVDMDADIVYNNKHFTSMSYHESSVPTRKTWNNVTMKLH